MKKITNGTHLEGYLFGHTLELKESGPNSKNPGTEYIAGNIEVATDEDGMNVVPVTYRYVTARTKAGKDNATFKTLKTIIDSEGKTFQDCGTSASKLRVDTALGVNDFYNAEGELVSYQLNDGGFVHIVNAFTGERNRFEVDVVINNVTVKEADEERGTESVVIVKGATFNFMGSLLPVSFVAKSAAGMKFFEDLGASNAEPVFTKIWGNVVASTVQTETVEESAFGEDAVKISVRRLREWQVTGATPEAYDFGDEAVLTTAELTEAMQNREKYLAETKQRHDDYVASKATAGNASAAGTATPAGAPDAKPGNFSF